MKKYINNAVEKAGLYTLALRWVIGWTYFSALWRRLVLTDKLNPESVGYIGEKFNHFLPNALGLQSLIEYMVTNPDVLHISMIIFTVIEGIVGLLLIFGFFTRFMSIGVFFLAMGILLGSGWIGTTCLDEWQIGVLGVASGFILFLTGSGAYSVDNYLIKKSYRFTQTKWFAFLGSGNLPIKKLAPKVLIISIGIFGLTLFTNQYFHGGIYGPLHNKSVKPKIELLNVQHTGSQVTFQTYRVEGVDVYGSFLIGIQILDENNQIVKSIQYDELAQFPKEQIKNYYVAKVKPGAHSLIIPLGSRADITLDVSKINVGENYTLKLIDISGAEWTAKIK